MTNEAARWVPADDLVYAYDTVNVLTGETGVLVLRVRRTGPDSADLIAPRKTTRLRYAEEGIIKEREGTYLLRTPVAQGISWPAGPNMSASIARVGFAVTTPMGRLGPCAEVVEQRTGAAAGTLTSVYCRDVGLVSLEAKRDGTEPEHMRVTLRTVGKPVDLGPDGVTRQPVR